MAYSDYGALIYRNGERRRDKEDVAVFATDEEIFGTDSANIPSGARIWVSLLHQSGEYNWLNSIYHGVMGDGPVRVMCHKQGLPQIYEMTDDGPKEIKYCDESVDPYEYGTIDFEYKGYRFRFEDGHPYTMTMTEPDGTVWLGLYDYEFGAGFEDRVITKGGEASSMPNREKVNYRTFWIIYCFIAALLILQRIIEGR